MAGPAAGQFSAIGIAEEVTYGTAVAPARWYGYLSESLEKRKATLQADTLRAGNRNLRRGAHRVFTTRDAGGDISMPFAVSGMGLLLKHMLGSTPTTVQQAATAAYLQTHALGNLQGKSLTVQKLVRDTTNSLITRYTYPGSKIAGWGISVDTGGFAQLRLTVDARDEESTTAAGTPSYSNADLLHFQQASLTVGGSPVANALSAEVNGTNNLKTDRYFLGNAGLKGEPIDSGYPDVSGTFSAEFESADALYTAFAADTAVALVLTFQADVIASTYYEKLVLTIPQVRLEGETPKAGGPDVLVRSIPFTALYDGSAAGITAEYTSVDTAP